VETPRLFFLGTPKIELVGTPITLPSTKIIALLAYLASQREPAPRDRLLGLLWADSTNDAARKNLRNALWAIRKTLGDDVLTASDDQLALGENVWSDVREFNTLGNVRAMPIDAQAEIEKRKSIIELYRAPFLDGINLPNAPDFEIWLTVERERLAQLHLHLLDDLVQFYRARNDWHNVIAIARRALAHDNLQEPMHRVLMQAYAYIGERTQALRQYDALREILERELGVAPLPETEQLRTAILAGEIGTIPIGATLPHMPVAPAQNEIPFVGRTAECAELDQALTIAARGTPRIALLAGELGIGKSRLWREWSASHRQSATLLETRCLASTQALPFAPLIELLNQPLIRAKIAERAISPIWLAEIARLAPDICAEFANAHASATLPPEEERRRIFEALTQCLLTMPSPLVLFIDDAHWADRATLDWLDYLAHRFSNRALLLVIAYRIEDAPAPLVHRLSDWGREGLTHRLMLSRLTDDEATVLVNALGGDPALAMHAQHQSAGNPYFLIELCRAKPATIPPALNDLLRARLAVLPDTVQQIVQAAAILEPSFDFSTLRRTSGRGEEETLRALDTLLAANLLIERDARYDFAHPLVATIVREGLSAARRTFLHRRAAVTLETLHRKRLPQIAGTLAMHYAQADDAPRAAQYAQLAAEHALALAAPDEAVNFYHQAIRFESTPARQVGLGNAYLRLGDLAAARRAFETALATFEKENDRPGAARTCLNLAETFYPAGRFDEGRQWTEKALTYLGGVSDPEGHALVHLMLATNRLNASQITAQDVAHAQEAIDLAEANHLAAINIRAHFILGNLLAQQGQFAQAVEAFLTTARLAQIAGDDYQQTLGYNNAAYHSLLAGEVAAAREYVAQGLALADERALKLPLQYLYSTRGEIALAEKNWDESEQWFTRGLAESEARGNIEQAANYHANLALAARGRGDLESALILLEKANAQAATTNSIHLRAQIDLWHAELYLARGERAAAKEALARAETRLRDSGRAYLIDWAARVRADLNAKL
jgi:DNA-binding SARP family transcriptional activator/predicted ATPase